MFLISEKSTVGERVRTDNAIAAGVAEEIRTGAWELGIRQRSVTHERHTPRCDVRSCLGQLEALVIHVPKENPARITLEIVVHWIASGNDIRNRENVGADVLYSERLGRDQRSGWNPAIQLDNAAQLPPAYDPSGESVACDPGTARCR